MQKDIKYSKYHTIYYHTIFKQTFIFHFPYCIRMNIHNPLIQYCQSLQIFLLHVYIPLHAQNQNQKKNSNNSTVPPKT